MHTQSIKRHLLQSRASLTGYTNYTQTITVYIKWKLSVVPHVCHLDMQAPGCLLFLHWLHVAARPWLFWRRLQMQQGEEEYAHACQKSCLHLETCTLSFNCFDPSSCWQTASSNAHNYDALHPQTYTQLLHCTQHLGVCCFRVRAMLTQKFHNSRRSGMCSQMQSCPPLQNTKYKDT